MKIVDVSMWKMGSFIEGNVVNNLAVLWVLLLSTEVSLFPENLFGVYRQFITSYHFISCTDNSRRFSYCPSISLSS